MRKILAIVMAFVSSGCSVWMTNKTSPLKLDGCHWWPAVVDGALASGAATTGVMLHQEQIFEEPVQNDLALTVGLLIGSGFLMSVVMGLTEYSDCEGMLPLCPPKECKGMRSQANDVFCYQ